MTDEFFENRPRQLPSCFLSILFFALTLNLMAQLEPENVWMEGYTFTRPKSWQWTIPNKNSTALTHFSVPGQGTNTFTEVRFYTVIGTREELEERIRKNFQGPPVITDRMEKVGAIELTYVIAKGTAIRRKNGRDYLWTGLILPRKAGAQPLLARILGPRSEVETALPDFKKMIQEAVQEEREP